MPAQGGSGHTEWPATLGAGQGAPTWPATFDAPTYQFVAGLPTDPQLLLHRLLDIHLNQVRVACHDGRVAPPWRRSRTSR